MPGRRSHTVVLGAQLQVGTMYPSLSHPEKTEVEGLQLMEEVRQSCAQAAPQRPGTAVCHTRLPLLIGVGGIDATNAGPVIAAGADGVAVIRCHPPSFLRQRHCVAGAPSVCFTTGGWGPVNPVRYELTRAITRMQGRPCEGRRGRSKVAGSHLTSARPPPSGRPGFSPRWC